MTTVTTSSTTLWRRRRRSSLARRKELVAAAKKRGDADAAKVIGAARRPTTAAWVVNVLVRADATARAARRAERGAARGARGHGRRPDPRIVGRAAQAGRRIGTDRLRRGRRRAARRRHCATTWWARCRPRSPTPTSPLGWAGWRRPKDGLASAISARRPRWAAQGDRRSRDAESQPGRATAADASSLPPSERVAAAGPRRRRRGRTAGPPRRFRRTAKLADRTRRYEKLLETLGAAEASAEAETDERPPDAPPIRTAGVATDAADRPTRRDSAGSPRRSMPRYLESVSGWPPAPTAVRSRRARRRCR